MTNADDVPEDWATTCAIYDLDCNSNVIHPSSTRCLATCDIKILRRDVALVQPAPSPLGALDPYFCYRIVRPSQSPVVHVIFHYSRNEEDDDGDMNDEELTLESAEIRCVEFPDPWPHEARVAFESWLGQKAADLLMHEESGMSFAVCEFVEHRALDFFGRSTYGSGDEGGDSNIDDGEEGCYDDDVLACMDYGLAEHEIVHRRLKTHRARNVVVDGHAFHRLSPLERKVRRAMHERYRDWVEITCPICFDKEIASRAVEITCGHYFCRDCISMYARTVVNDIRQHTSNPFRCPMPACRQDMNIEGCVKDLVSEEDTSVIEEWLKDLKFPRSNLLVVCPRTKMCGVRGQMRKSSRNSSMVYCDECGKTWCELCMQRYEGEHFDCDQVPVQRLCDNYRQASDKIKAKAQERWPWIREYAAARNVDDSAVLWVKENASTCPNCRTGIERVSGCFHMNCTNCGAHFCYECGEELVAPYYGTHHCWLNNNNFEDG